MPSLCAVLGFTFLWCQVYTLVSARINFQYEGWTPILEYINYSMGKTGVLGGRERKG